ncbi:hypothetical protein HDU96_008567 [Phlyctochytrium bullatum]|nr:hypothetical protein HDU96_008567 [Phlyctochytrium bullatum]
MSTTQRVTKDGFPLKGNAKAPVEEATSEKGQFKPTNENKRIDAQAESRTANLKPKSKDGHLEEVFRQKEDSPSASRLAPPMSLGKSKRKIVEKMAKMSPKHIRFFDDDENSESMQENYDTSGEKAQPTGSDDAHDQTSEISETDACDLDSVTHLNQTNQKGVGKIIRTSVYLYDSPPPPSVPNGTRKHNGSHEDQIGSMTKDLNPSMAHQLDVNTVHDLSPSRSTDSWKVKDYSQYPALKGLPRIGSVLAFKTLELSALYTPELSQYKEGTVLQVDAASSMVTIELREGFVNQQPITPAADGVFKTIPHRKFSVELEGDEGTTEQLAPAKPGVVTYHLSSLVGCRHDSKLEEVLESLYPSLVRGSISLDDARASPEMMLKLFRITQLKNMYLESAETQIQTLEALTEEKQRYSNLLESTRQLENDMKEQLQSEVETLTQELEATVGELERNAKEQESTQQLLVSNDITIDELTEERDALKVKLEELIEGLQERDSNESFVVGRLKEQLADYESQLEDAQDDFRVLSADWDRIDALVKGRPSVDIDGLKSQASVIKKLKEQSESLRAKREEDANHYGVLKIQLQEKESELIELKSRIDAYESGDSDLFHSSYLTGVYGLNNAIIEIKDLKLQMEIRQKENERLTKQINDRESQISDIIDENSELRRRLGISKDTLIDISNLRHSRALELQESKALNTLLKKEIETLEEERLKLKKLLRHEAVAIGQRAVSAGLSSEELIAVEEYASKLRAGEHEFLHGEGDRRRPPIQNDELKKLVFELERLHRDCDEARLTINDLQNNGLPLVEKLIETLETKKMKELTRDIKGDSDVEQSIIQINTALRDKITGLTKRLEHSESEREKANARAQKAEEALRNRHASKLLSLSSPADFCYGSIYDYSSLVEYLVQALRELHVKTEELKNCKSEFYNLKSDLKDLEITANEAIERLLHSKRVVLHQMRGVEDSLQNTVARQDYENALNMMDFVRAQQIARMESAESVLKERLKLADGKWEMLQQSESQLRSRLQSTEELYVAASEQIMELRKEILDLKTLYEGGATRKEKEELERHYNKLRDENFQLSQEISDQKELVHVANAQAEDLLHIHKVDMREKEILQAAIHELQIEDDHKLLVGKLHNHILALQVSEASVLKKLEKKEIKCQKLENSLRHTERALEECEKQLSEEKMLSRSRTGILYKKIADLRVLTSGHVALEAYEIGESANFLNKLAETNLQLNSLNELIAALREEKGEKEKIITWHSRMTAVALENLRLSRENSVFQKRSEEYQKSLQDCMSRITALEEDYIRIQSESSRREIEWDLAQEHMEKKLRELENERESILRKSDIEDVAMTKKGSKNYRSKN